MNRQEYDQYLNSISNGDFSAAAKFATSLLQPDETSPLHLCNRAYCHLKLDLYRKCIKDCDAAIAIDFTCAPAYLRKGEAFLKMGKPVEAKNVFLDGLSRAIGDVEMMLQLKRGSTGEDISKQRQVEQVQTSPDSSTSTPSVTPGSSSTSPSLEVLDSAGRKLELDESVKKLDLEAGQAQALAQVAARGMVQNGVGNAVIDQRIALGNLQVNTGKYAQGIKIFSELITEFPTTVAAYLGRGTALAMSGNLYEAHKDFTAALKLNPQNIDGLKRRAQVSSAINREAEALVDLNTAVSLSKDADSYHQRGACFHKLRNYQRAHADFAMSAKLDHANKATYNYMGLCHLCLGQPKEALESYKKALALDPSYKEALANLGQVYKEWAKEEDALKYFAMALKIDPSYTHAHYLRGLAYFGIGLHRLAYNDFTNALKCDQSLFEAWWMRGVCASGMGMEVSATTDFDRALALRPDHACWYQRQLSLFYHHHMDVPFSKYNLDTALDPEFKEWWCKRNPPKSSLKKQPNSSSSISDVDVTGAAPAWLAQHLPTRELMEFAESVGKWVHQDSPGFLKNRRQIAMAGFAAVEIAQTLRRVWGFTTSSSSPSPATSSNSNSTNNTKQGNNKAAKKAGKQQSNASSSTNNNSASQSPSPSSTNPEIVDGKCSSGDTKPHKFGWRDMYDIVVKWRQYSEPNDPVYWVDKLPPEQFLEGFGSHTPIFTGQCKVIRYGRMFERTLPIMKMLMRQQCVLDSDRLRDLDKATSVEQLYRLQNRDFFVVTPCHSIASPGKIMEGTRLTIQSSPPEGYEYSIRTPGTPPRWVDYDDELSHLFAELTAEAKKQNGASSDKLAELILSIAYYWYNFMPLARGTAICGYVSILGMFLAVGTHIKAPIPANALLDWDAILLPTPKEFIDTCSPWLLPHRHQVDTSVLDSLPLVGDTFPTLRHMFTLLNTVCKQ